MNVGESELPDHLVDAWNDLLGLERQVHAALQEPGDLEGIATLAKKRHGCLVKFFENLPANNETAVLREKLLQRLLAANQQVLEISQGKLAEAAGAAVSASRTKHAVAAYHAQD